MVQILAARNTKQAHQLPFRHLTKLLQIFHICHDVIYVAVRDTWQAQQNVLGVVFNFNSK